jgi:hypothetical protein
MSNEAKKVWIRGEIEDMLRSNDRAVERAMVAIWERQTMDEQVTQNVKHSNNRGFSHWSARSGTYYAEWVRKGGRLTGKHLDKARKIALHHAGQLTDFANGKR